MEKIFVLSTDGKLIIKFVNIPNNITAQVYFKSVFSQMSKMSDFEAFLLLMPDESIIYQHKTQNHSISGNYKLGDKYCIIDKIKTPGILEYISIETDYKGVGVVYNEIDFIKYHQDYFKTFPIDDSLKVDKFLEFIVNDLNLFSHSNTNDIKKLIDDYISNEINVLFDCDGNKINLVFGGYRFLQAAINTCLTINSKELIDKKISNLLKEKYLLKNERIDTAESKESSFKPLKIFETFSYIKESYLDCLKFMSNNFILSNGELSNAETKAFMVKYPFDKPFNKLEIEKWCNFNITLHNIDPIIIYRPASSMKDALHSFGKFINELYGTY